MPAYVPPALRNKAPNQDRPPNDGEKTNKNDPTDQVLSRESLSPRATKTGASNRFHQFPQRRQDNSNFHTLSEIHHYYWPNEETLPSDPKPTHSTLNASERKPGKLAYLMLFKGANPRWEPDGIVFVKTGLDLLKGSVTEKHAEDGKRPDHFKSGGRSSINGEPNEKTEAEHGQVATSDPPFPTHQIAAFAQSPGLRQDQRAFRFLGYYIITAVDLLEPNSPEMVKMLGQKWGQNPLTPITSSAAPATDASKTTKAEDEQRGWGIMKPRPRGKVRDPEKWKESLSIPWAVVKFVSCEQTGEQREGLAPPKIERLADELEEPKENKSVNEMLKEMRLEGRGEKGGAEGFA